MDVEPISIFRSDTAGLSWLMATRAPHPGLSAHVFRYCGYVEHADQPVRRRQVANGHVALIISFEDSLDLVDMTKSPRPTGRFRSFVVGFHAGYAITEYVDRQHGVQVDLTPLGAYRLLAMPASEIANQVVPLDALYPSIRGRDNVQRQPTEAMSMIDHFFLPVTDLERSRAFYRELLGPLGIEESFVRKQSVGFGVGSPGAFWIYATTGRGEVDDPCGRSPEATVPCRTCTSASAPRRGSQVKDFSTAAERLSAELVHPPQLFEQYHPSCFGAFFRDPDGHNIEAACHAPS